MAESERVHVGRVGALRRYPVKSMLGEAVDSVDVGPGGVDGDRRFGVVDHETGMVASAKTPRHWRALLQARAESSGPGEVTVRLPDGRRFRAGDADADRVLSEYLGRPVTLAAEAAKGATLEHSAPEAILEQGLDAVVESSPFEIAGVSPAGTFFDYSPMQFVTTASLARAGELHPAGRIDAVRYRPNVIIDTGDAPPGFVENGWVGHHLAVGPEVVLDVLIPSPRCVIPTLPHGALPADPEALRIPTRHNFVEVPMEGFGAMPCLGAHAGVVRGGRLTAGDDVWLLGVA